MCKFLNKFCAVLQEWCYPIGSKTEDNNLWWHEMWSVTESVNIQINITIKHGLHYSITYWSNNSQTTTSASIPAEMYDGYDVVLTNVTLGSKDEKPLYIEVESEEQPYLTYNIDGTIIYDVPMFKK